MNVDKILKFVEKGNVDKLADIADGKDLDMAKAAISGMAKIKRDESFNYMISNIRNSNKERRLAVIAALGDLGMPRAKTHLRHVIETDTDKDIVEAAKQADARISSGKM